MTDWHEIQENIKRAAEASERFQKASEALLASQTRSDAEAFARRVRELQAELERIFRLIAPGSPVAVDEIAEVVSRALGGRTSGYRITDKPPEPPVG